MKIVIAPDSFKECLTAAQVAQSIENGMRQIFPEAEYVQVPVADGGEGTLQSLVDATQGRFIEVTVTGPLGEPVNACFGLLGNGDTAMIEMAQASGIELVRPETRNPLIATTFGTGELIKAALVLGVRHFIIGIGGSATNDGGAGMLQAMGIKLLDDNNQELEHGGAALAKLSHIDLAAMDERLKQCTFIAACDVNNPLTGVNGASATFGPQKGATPERVA